MLDLGTRDADVAWQIIVQHAANIDRADLRYRVDIFREFPGDDLNSNSGVPSVLSSVGLDWAQGLPVGSSRSEAPLYGQLRDMEVNDVFRGTADSGRIVSGVGNNRAFGDEQNDSLTRRSANDRLYGNLGDNYFYGGCDDIGRFYDHVVRGPPCQAGTDWPWLAQSRSNATHRSRDHEGTVRARGPRDWGSGRTADGYMFDDVLRCPVNPISCLIGPIYAEAIVSWLCRSSLVLHHGG